MISLHHASCIDWLANYDGPLFDACVTDPPYHLTSIVKRFGGKNAAEAKVGATGAYARASKGFMGKEWDGGDIAFRPETWRAVYDALKPGAHLVAFSGTRTYHRMACAIEDAGFEIRDMLMWTYGSGFPKSHDVSKGIDKTRGETGRDLEFCAFMRSTNLRAGEANRILQKAGAISPNGTTAGHFFAKSLAGQPAIATRDIFEVMRPHLGVIVPDRIEEIINRAEAERKIVGQKTSGIANLKEGQRHTIGASQSVVIDITAPATPEAEQWQGWGTALKPALEPICLARKPLSEKSVAANVLKHGTGAINIDGSRVEAPDGVPSFDKSNKRGGMIFDVGSNRTGEVTGRGRWPANLCHDSSDEVLAGFPDTHGAGTFRSGSSWGNVFPSRDDEGREQQRPAFDNGGSAARFFYSAKAGPLDRIGTAHATVKPVDLMRWLCRLVTPPGGHILEPFAGSGTTGIAAMAEGFDCSMIELEADHVADIERKLAYLRGEGALTFQEHNHAKALRTKETPLGGLFGEAV